MGVGRDGRPKSNFTRGLELRGKYTLLAEGMRRSLTKRIVERFKLDEGRDPQKYVSRQCEADPRLGELNRLVRASAIFTEAWSGSGDSYLCF